MIAVIGAGIAGLSTAHQLALRGADVLVLEAGEIACGASGVATSYLEPRRGKKTAARLIEQEALRRWPDYAAQLEQASGVDVEFRDEGQIRVSLAENQSQFDADIRARLAGGDSFELITPQQARSREPALSEHITSAAFLSHIRWITGAKVCQALAVAIAKLGGEVRQFAPVVKLQHFENGVRLQIDGGASLEVEKTVICTGIGAVSIDGFPVDIPASRPVRGVNLIVDQSALDQPLQHMIKHHRGNLCPRSGNLLIVGTTYEAGEFSLTPDSDVIERIYQNAEPILPAVRQLPLLDVVAGLRSKIGDGNLRLGRSSANPNIYYSLSHAGAGYLRAPVVADEFAEFVLTGKQGQLCAENFHV